MTRPPDRATVAGPAAACGRREFLRLTGLLALASPMAGAWTAGLFAAPLDQQPLVASVRRLVDAMAYLGEPFDREGLDAFERAAGADDLAQVQAAIDRLVDPRCLLAVRINPESRVTVSRGGAPARLVEDGWRAFLVKVQNEAGVTAPLTVESPQARPVYRPATGNAMAPPSVMQADIRDRWLALQMHDEKPLEPALSGLPLEYRIVLLYSRDRGQREAQLGAIAGTGSEDVGFRNRVAVLFTADPAQDLVLRVADEQGRPCMASLLVKDALGRVYPARSKRLAPDFFFQEQVYRDHGESLRLPPGEYAVTIGRGPEYVPDQQRVVIPATGAPAPLESRLRRWIDPAAQGWYSGDHHVHAAGCSHYESPTEGVRPEDMMRHVLGEALSVASVLNWGPGYYHQRQYFEGRDNRLSTASTLLHYDLEVSGFPSSHCGHLVLLRLHEQDYPETRQIEDWPSWDLPILRWAKAQGAVTGFAHTGWGLPVASTDLPNFEVPPYDGIGANEYIVDVTHDAVDFISAVDTPYVDELNIWYHTLNCGFRTRLSGETDFPCITDERVGGGRSYVGIADGLTYEKWCEGVRSGRCYVSDGYGHLIDFSVNGVAVGVNQSELSLAAPGTVTVAAKVACLLPEQEPESAPEIRKVPYWTPEHARVRGTREALVEVVVNGRAVASTRLPGDGTLRDVRLEVPIARSSWIALRLKGCAHTNPVFAIVGGRPIRASRQSAEWCLAGVERCWTEKGPRIRTRERAAAAAAYDYARERYRRLIEESEVA